MARFVRRRFLTILSHFLELNDEISTRVTMGEGEVEGGGNDCGRRRRVVGDGGSNGRDDPSHPPDTIGLPKTGRA